MWDEPLMPRGDVLAMTGRSAGWCAWGLPARLQIQARGRGSGMTAMGTESLHDWTIVLLTGSIHSVGATDIGTNSFRAVLLLTSTEPQLDTGKSI
jgi:hypothetical protein